MTNRARCDKMVKEVKMIIGLIIILIGCAIGVAVVIRGFWENQNPVLTEYKIEKTGLPSNFKGLKIAHISDYHNTEIGKDNKKLLDLLKSAKPDIIVITGDIIDSRKTREDVALQFAKQLTEIAPCYYSNGNHESRYKNYDSLAIKLKDIGVAVLHNERVGVSRGGQKIFIAGLTSPRFYTAKKEIESASAYVRKTLEKLKGETDEFTVVLSHHPEYAKEYEESGVDMIFSGHAHGGQFILPLIGGLYAPEQGILPKYTQGVRDYGKTHFVISRGIGNSSFPFRFLNRPEIVLVQLT